MTIVDFYYLEKDFLRNFSTCLIQIDFYYLDSKFLLNKTKHLILSDNCWLILLEFQILTKQYETFNFVC